MSKKKIILIILAFGFVAGLVFCINSSTKTGGGGGLPTGCESVEGTVTYQGLVDSCYYVARDSVRIRYFDCSSCQWTITMTSIHSDGGPYHYHANWPANACEIYVKGVCPGAPGCASDEHRIERDWCTGTTYTQNLVMKHKCLAR